jgi:hypothetical protein
MGSIRGLSLQEDEEVLHSFRPKISAWFWPILLTCGLWLPVALWNRRKVRYVVTDKRVIKKRGRLSSSTEEFRLSDVSRLETNRSFGERILGGGTITLDTGVDQMTLKAVPKHSTVAATIRGGQTD